MAQGKVRTSISGPISVRLRKNLKKGERGGIGNAKKLLMCGVFVLSGFLVDWGRRSPLYPAAAAAAAKDTAKALGKSWVFSAGNDTTVKTAWVWHDTACNADVARIFEGVHGIYFPS